MLSTFRKNCLEALYLLAFNKKAIALELALCQIGIRLCQIINKHITFGAQCLSQKWTQYLNHSPSRATCLKPDVVSRDLVWRGNSVTSVAVRSPASSACCSNACVCPILHDNRQRGIAIWRVFGDSKSPTLGQSPPLIGFPRLASTA